MFVVDFEFVNVTKYLKCCYVYFKSMLVRNLFEKETTMV